MSTQSSAVSGARFVGNDRVLFGIIFGVLAFWLFAQTMLNISPVMADDLGIDTTAMNIAVSITALFSGIFIVVIGSLADRYGRVRVVQTGFVLSIIGSLLVGLAPTGGVASTFLMVGRIFQGLSGAFIMSASLALVKAYWDGPHGSGRSRCGPSARGADPASRRSSAGSWPRTSAGGGSSLPARRSPCSAW